MNTIFVTGGAGFIGSNYIFNHINCCPEDRIVCVDALTYAGNLETLSSIRDGETFRFSKIDITDRELISSLFEEERPDIVINFAAESHVDRSIANPGIFTKTNVVGTQVLLDCSMKWGVKRFHQVSTDEVYGSLPIDKPEIKFIETTNLNPSSPYSASKAGADFIVNAYHRTFGLPVSISRCSNNYGPYQFPEKLIPLMISKALRGEDLPIYGDGLNVRDWLFVTDHCNAIDFIISKGSEGEVYNIGGNNERSNIDIVKTILSELGVSESLIKFVPDRKGHDRRYAINSEKIKNELGWKPQISFDVGIRKTINWYLEHLSWVNHILDKSYLNFRR